MRLTSSDIVASYTLLKNLKSITECQLTVRLKMCRIFTIQKLRFDYNEIMKVGFNMMAK